MSAKVNIVTRNHGTYQLKRSVAARKVRRESLTYRWLDNFTIVEVEPAPPSSLHILFCDGLLGTGNLLPFAKPNNYGDKLHYETPMANDIGLRRHGLYRRGNKLLSHVIRVSARMQLHTSRLATA